MVSGNSKLFATIITIGDELLIGQVIDTNSAFIGQELSKIGFTVRRRIAVGDEKQEIISALDEAKAISDLILITGGLGPTNDDITKHTLSEYFGSKPVMNEEILTMVKNIFQKLNRPMPDVNKKQAELPDNCIPIKNFFGTAPGMWFVQRTPDGEREEKVFVAMPGVPFEMKPMMTDLVVPKLKSHFSARSPSGETPIIIHRTIHTQGIGESFLAEKIKDIEESFPENFKLAYLPHYSLLRLRITATGSDETSLRTQVKVLEEKIRGRVGEFIFGYDDTSLEKEIGILLREKNKTVSIAESCTGGLVAHKLVSVPGASEYFVGSIVSYSYDLKKMLLDVKEETLATYGAVSEEAVREMLMGALKKTKSDYAISISGIAGPGGGTADKPVGTVWIAVGSNEKIILKKFFFTRGREIIMEYTAIAALGMLWRFMTG
ncbi:MAG TPA: competence/damage-inducible protein A [Chitinophagales bacterium]|nr:competence/damage-inducible protein A [Chitinophagales bacterium]